METRRLSFVGLDCSVIEGNAQILWVPRRSGKCGGSWHETGKLLVRS